MKTIPNNNNNNNITNTIQMLSRSSTDYNNKVGTRYWTIRLRWGPPVQDESAYVGGEDCDRS